MMHLSQLFRRPPANVRTTTVVIFLVVALVGFADATFLTVEHYRGVIPPCSVTQGCDSVLTSAYSAIGGVPVSLLGALFYLVIAVAAFLYLEARATAPAVGPARARMFAAALLLTKLGFLMTLWFLYVQAFVLHAFCQYCLGSAVTSTVLFIMAGCIIWKHLRTPADPASGTPHTNETKNL